MNMDTDKIIIKNDDQIEGIRKSCKLAAQCLKMAENLIVEGVLTKDIDDAIDEFIKSSGGISACRGYNGYPAATCISVNEVVCHGIPNDYRLKNGDILNIDVTTIVDGYYGDCSTMYCVGKIDDAQSSSDFGCCDGGTYSKLRLSRFERRKFKAFSETKGEHR
jgi:methionyl aminopeptidase